MWIPSELKDVSIVPSVLYLATKASPEDPWLLVVPPITIFPSDWSRRALQMSSPFQSTVTFPSPEKVVSRDPSDVMRAIPTSSPLLAVSTCPQTRILLSDEMAPEMHLSSLLVEKATHIRPLAALVAIVTVAALVPLELKPVVSKSPSACLTETMQS